MNNLDRITKAMNKAKAIIASLPTDRLLEIWEMTEDINNEYIPTVRGWLMDEFESRDPEGYNRWLECDLCIDQDLKYFIKGE